MQGENWPRRFTIAAILWIIRSGHGRAKNRQEARLQELILSAKRMNIHVRTEKLLREAGYRAKSGSCRVNGRDLILIDRDARLSDQIEFLTSELAERQADSGSSIIAVPSSED